MTAAWRPDRGLPMPEAPLHLHAMAAWMQSVNCGPPEVTSRPGLAAALVGAVPDRHGWIRGTGHAETVAGDMHAAALDRLRSDRPVCIQHRSGATETAARTVGCSGQTTGCAPVCRVPPRPAWPGSACGW